MRIVLVVAICIALVPFGSAQSARDLSILNLHEGGAGLWMDEVADHPDDGGGLLLDSSGEIGDEPTDLAFPLEPVLGQDLSLDGNPIEATIVLGAAYLGGAAPTTPPVPVTVTVTLKAGDTIIASGSAEGSLPDGTVSDSSSFTISMAPSTAHIVAADNLVAIVDISSDTPTGPFFLQTSGESNLALPLVFTSGSGISMGSGQTSATVPAGESASFNLTIAGTAGTNYSLAAEGLPDGYTATFSPANGTLEADPQGVSVEISVPASAAEGIVNFNATVSSGGSRAASLALNLTVTAAADPEPDEETTSEPDSPDVPGGDDNSTADGDEKEGEKAPGLSLVPLVAAVAVAMVLRRRF